MIILTIAAVLIAYIAGWLRAHRTIAQECKKLGKFYVGKEVFECTKISGPETEEEVRARLRRGIHQNGPSK